jgi:hypothetical protein
MFVPAAAPCPVAATGAMLAWGAIINQQYAGTEDIGGSGRPRAPTVAALS